jgi:methylation protein EvaC
VRRGACGSCNGDLRDFLDLGSSPPANRFPASADDPETWYPLQVAVCTRCWLAQLREVVPGSELYGDDYGFRTGASPASVRYFAAMAAALLGKYGDRAAQLTVEIACNDGTLLARFRDAGCRVLGVDPARGAAAEAIARGLDVITEPFTSRRGLDIRGAYGPAGLVIACNVAAHVSDPRDFLRGIATLLGDHAVAVIEFQDAEKLIAGCQVDHVYHEHRFFYSLRSFARLALNTGLSVIDWERTPAQGGSLRVVLQRHTTVPVSVPAGSTWLENWTPYEDMQGRAWYARTRLLEMIAAERDEGRVVAGYGASAKAVTLLNWCDLGPEQIPWIEDTTPGKAGRLIPGRHIPVRAPGTRPDTYLMTVWNYLSDVIRRESGFLAGGGRMIIPGPVPVLL